MNEYRNYLMKWLIEDNHARTASPMSYEEWERSVHAETPKENIEFKFKCMNPAHTIEVLELLAKRYNDHNRESFTATEIGVRGSTMRALALRGVLDYVSFNEESVKLPNGDQKKVLVRVYALSKNFAKVYTQAIAEGEKQVEHYRTWERVWGIRQERAQRRADRLSANREGNHNRAESLQNALAEISVEL